MAKILIVDDERSIRTTLAEFIREEGHEVFTAEDAAKALEILVDQMPAVVVTDIILPRMTGVSLLKRINEIAPDVQVLMITGEPTAETAAEAVRSGAFDYLSKPIARADFKSSVTSALRVTELALERRRLEEENRQYQEHLEEEVERKTGALRESEEKYRAVVENASEAVFIAQDGVLPFANPSTARISGRSLETLRTTPFLECVHPEDRAVVRNRHERRLRGEPVPAKYEFRLVTPENEVRWIELQPVLITWEDRPATLNFASDITERKLAEHRELARQERIKERDAALVELAMDSILYQGPLEVALRAVSEASAHTLDVNRVSIDLFDESRMGLECVDAYVPEHDRHERGDVLERSAFPSYFRALEEQRAVFTEDAEHDLRTAELWSAHLSSAGVTAVLDAPVRLEGRLVGVVRHQRVKDADSWEPEDIDFASSIANLVSLVLEATSRRQAEEERAQSELRYRTLFEGSPVALWQEDFSATKAFVLQLLDRGVTDLRMHFRDHPGDLAEAIRRVRIVDVNEATLRLHRADSKEQLLKGLEDVLSDGSADSFVDQLIVVAEGKTFYEGTAVDKTLDGEDIHVAVRWIAARGYEESLERVLVSKIDITGTVEAERSLQQALDGTIGAIGMTTETRDPYTAGHQRRVTELAVAIAERMNLEPDIVEGTRVAGLMHDIGKLAIPAEILSKPSRLNDMERSLIQTHPQAAYDILQTVTFPWPIAQIVLQHHERIDGSGYPNALENDDILVQARILAVADTVEAMASHRPYRPALGIDAALEEIEAHRGTKFDPEVVDACLALFREGAFTFRSAT